MSKNVSAAFDCLLEKLSQMERVRNGHIVTGSPNTRKYRYVKECLSNFTEKVMKLKFERLTFEQIDREFLQKYIAYLNGQNVDNKLQKLKRLFREASASAAVFDEIKESQPKTNSPKQVDHSCIAKILKMDRSQLSPKEQLYIDLFLFGYCTGGSTINELATLRRDDIRDGYLYCERITSGKTAKIPLCDLAIKIIDRHSDKTHGDYLLPILTDKHATTEQQTGRIKRVTELTNQTLKRVAATLRLEGEITMSLTRRIYIELMLCNDVAFERIAECVGCTFETVFRYHEKLLKMCRENQIHIDSENLISKKK